MARPTRGVVRGSRRLVRAPAFADTDAIATSAGLYAAARLRSIAGYAIAVVLIALPHIIGAPHPETPGGLAPEELQHKFIIAAVA